MFRIPNSILAYIEINHAQTIEKVSTHKLGSRYGHKTQKWLRNVKVTVFVAEDVNNTKVAINGALNVPTGVTTEIVNRRP